MISTSQKARHQCQVNLVNAQGGINVHIEKRQFFEITIDTERFLKVHKHAENAARGVVWLMPELSTRIRIRHGVCVAQASGFDGQADQLRGHP